MQDFLKQFEFIKSKYDSGSGFWNRYRKKEEWLGRIIEITIAAKNIPDDVWPLLQNFMDNQPYWDDKFKRFAAEKLLLKLKRKWKNELLTLEDVMETIKVSAIIFNFESKEIFGVWFTTGSEHEVQVYGDKHGNLTRAAMG